MRKLCSQFMIVFLCGFSSATYAHKLNMFAYVEDNNVFLEGYFSDGIPARNSDITVYNSNEKVVTTSKTDSEGRTSFPVSEKGSLRIVLNAGMGHVTEYKLDDGAVVLLNDAASTGDATNPAAMPSASPETDKIASIVRKAVFEANKPLAKELDSLKNRTGLSDIIGGIGFIVGILGVFAYAQARKKLQNGDLKG